jgi:hypothetical protein
LAVASRVRYTNGVLGQVMLVTPQIPAAAAVRGTTNEA